MPAFTTMALMGVAAAGGMFASRKLAPKPSGQTTAPSATTGATAPVTPPTTAESTSTNTATARTAGQRARRRATGRGGRTLTGRPGAQTQSLIQPAAEPRSLLGS